MILGPRFSAEADRLLVASERCFEQRPRERLDAAQVVRLGWTREPVAAARWAVAATAAGGGSTWTCVTSRLVEETGGMQNDVVAPSAC